MKRSLAREIPRVLLHLGLHLGLRLGLAFGLYGLIGAVPWPPETGHWIGVASFALLATTVIVICGTLLYDTLFYDHYWRKVDSR